MRKVRGEKGDEWEIYERKNGRRIPWQKGLAMQKKKHTNNIKRKVHLSARWPSLHRLSRLSSDSPSRAAPFSSLFLLFASAPSIVPDAVTVYFPFFVLFFLIFFFFSAIHIQHARTDHEVEKACVQSDQRIWWNRCQILRNHETFVFLVSAISHTFFPLKFGQWSSLIEFQECYESYELICCSSCGKRKQVGFLDQGLCFRVQKGAYNVVKFPCTCTRWILKRLLSSHVHRERESKLFEWSVRFLSPSCLSFFSVFGLFFSLEFLLDARATGLLALPEDYTGMLYCNQLWVTG